MLFIATSIKNHSFFYAQLAKLDKAIDCKSRDCGFNSHIVLQYQKYNNKGDKLKAIIFTLGSIFVFLVIIGLYAIHFDKISLIIYALFIPIYFVGIYFILKLKNRNINNF